jgi:hypothetical protein
MNVALERAKNEFEAAKLAKSYIMNRSQRDWMRLRIVEDKGMETIQYTITEAMENLDTASRAREEFPSDLQINIEVEMREAKLDAMINAGSDMIGYGDFGIKDAPKMKEYITYAKERRAYNNMFGEARTLYLTGEFDELTLMWQIIKETFDEKEIEYQDATAARHWNVEQIGKEFDKALTSYNASLNVQFDLEEMAEQEANKPNISISDEERSEIKSSIELQKNTKTSIVTTMKQEFNKWQSSKAKLAT